MDTLMRTFTDHLSRLFKRKDGYNITVNVYSVAQFIPVQRGCTGFMFTNTGDTIAQVNGMVIYPGNPGTLIGDSRSIAGHKNDIYKGNIQLKFIAPIGALPSVEIVQLFYVDEQ